MPPKRKKRKVSEKANVAPSIEKKAKKKAKVEVDNEEKSEEESKEEAKKVDWWRKKCARLEAKLRKYEAANTLGQYHYSPLHFFFNIIYLQFDRKRKRK